MRKGPTVHTWYTAIFLMSESATIFDQRPIWGVQVAASRRNWAKGLLRCFPKVGGCCTGKSAAPDFCLAQLVTFEFVYFQTL
jgi:hypothetical protein